MVSTEMITALLASGRAFEITPEGYLKVEASSRTANAERCARYRSNKKQVEKCQAMSEACHDTASTCPPAPSPSPSLPPSSPFPAPLSSPPTHTPPSAPPPTHAHTREGPGLDLELAQNPASKPQKPTKAWNPTEQQIQVASWFNRRPSTVWSDKEQKAWKALKLEDEDLEALTWFYTESGYPYLRKDLLTLLNNWRGEVDRAKNYNPEEEKRP